MAMRSGILKGIVAGGAIIAALLLGGCSAGKSGLVQTETGELVGQSRGRIVKINRRTSTFEMKPRTGGRLMVAWDEATALLNFQTMQEIKLDQPVEVNYLPGKDQVRALSLKKLEPAECN